MTMSLYLLLLLVKERGEGIARCHVDLGPFILKVFSIEPHHGNMRTSPFWNPFT